MRGIAFKKKYLILAAAVIIAALIICSITAAYAAASDEEVSGPLTSDSAPIKVKAYKLNDNTGYHEDQAAAVSAAGHPLRKNLINLSVYTDSYVGASRIDRGAVSSYDGYGVTGSSVSICLGYNFSNPERMFGYGGREYSISSDTARSVGKFTDIGVIGTGAMIFQKKTSADVDWEWQTKDGESKKQLHTFNFTDLARPQDYSGADKYTLYTPSGDDLSKGLFIKISFAYEIKYEIKWREKNWIGAWKDKSETHYVNMLETAEFYLVQNSGRVLFHNASNFNAVGEEDESGAISANKFETIKSGDVTLNGFRLDTLGIDAYDITYRLNGGDVQKAEDGQFFLSHGRYDFTIKRKIGAPVRYTIFVDRREVNSAVLGYFGKSLFTPESRRVFTTGEYPAYLKGARWNLNATDGTVAPIIGKLYKIVGEGEEKLVRDIAQKFGADYKTEALQGELNEIGLYKAEFWGNPRYSPDAELSGDLFHFVFRFEIVDNESDSRPSVNEEYLNGMIGFSDLQSKYYSIAMPTAGIGKAIFAFADYGGAYDFAYKLEREKVTNANGGYRYNGKTYPDQSSALAEIDNTCKKLITVRYFDPSDPVTYQTADVNGDNILKLNFKRDVIVFADDNEQDYMRAGLPSLNGRKFRYVSPDTDEIEDGTLSFAFVRIDGFESDKVALTHNASGAVYDIQFDVSVEYQLGLKNAPSGVYTVCETNVFGAESKYEAVYIAPGDMTGSASFSIYRNGGYVKREFSKGNTATVTNAGGFIFHSAANGLDPYSTVKVTKDGSSRIYTISEISDIWFYEGGVYDFVMSDRLGNSLEYSIIISAPVGYADIYLQLEQPDDSITTHYRAFVGETITLPSPTLTSELFVFDGWLYNDSLITDLSFTADASGTLYIWQQITQKYTYLSFDSDGGAPVERIKAVIGEPLELPVTARAGRAFGGWEYGGNVYTGAFTPSSASPIFKAVWNYEQTTIVLNDGNNRRTITAHAGDKVVLPFPTRTGYTFFGWREELSDGSIKVYYGQITKLANVETLSLDALWIRNGGVDADSLGVGTGGRTMMHFIDGELLPNDSIQSPQGASIALPKPTRAGFTFIGWIWRTTPISGKIYTGGTMTVPANAGNKLILEALWIAKSIDRDGGFAAGTLGGNNGGMLAGVALRGNIDIAAVASLGVFGICLPVVCCLAAARKRRRANVFDPIRDTNGHCYPNSERSENASAPIYMADAAEESNARCAKTTRRALACVSYSVTFIFTALLLAVVLSLTCMFGDWIRLGSFNEFASENIVAAADEREMMAEGEAAYTDDMSGSFDVAPMPTKEEVTQKFEELTAAADGNNITDELDLTEEDAFIYSLILFDLSSLNYNVFTAWAILPNNERILGLAYTDYENVYENIEENKLYFSAGFIALPRQKTITDAEINSGIKIDNQNKKQNNDGFSFFLAIQDNYGTKHCIFNNQYLVYNINKVSLLYSLTPESKAVFNPDFGIVYDYDNERVVFDPDIGKRVNIKSNSINTLLDPVIAKSEYNRYVAEQNANGFTVDTMNFVYISYEALDSYLLSEQDETLLGIDVQEFYDMERTVGPNEYYTVDANGNLTKLDFPPAEEDKASWLDRLAGAVLAIGMVCVGVIIVAAINMTTCGALAAASPYIMGAFIGGGVEVFMQTVIQGKKIEEINWLRVGIAAVSGATSAIPGIGWLGAGFLQGATEAAFTYADGGSLEDVLQSFTVGFVTGVVIHGAGKGIQSLRKCFVAGTGVLMASGAVKAIENVRIGDLVKSYDPIKGKAVNKRVLQAFTSDTSETVTVTTSDGQRVTATPGHQFYANGNWISVEDLKAGDILVNVNGQRVIVEKIQHEILETPVKVYNFNVDGNHNYYVVDNVNASIDTSILVHNVCQKHHVITNKMKKEMKNNPNLADISRNKSSIFTGLTEDAHKGYQEWHRNYDDEMLNWLKIHRNASLDNFQKQLQKFYDQPDIVKRFGNVIVNLFKIR